MPQGPASLMSFAHVPRPSSPLAPPHHRMLPALLVHWPLLTNFKLQMLGFPCRSCPTTPCSTPRAQVTSQLLVVGGSAVLQQKTTSNLSIPAGAPTTEATLYIVRYSTSDRACSLASLASKIMTAC